MTYPVYPTSDLDRPRKLLGLMGSVWTDVHPDRDFFEIRARMRLEMLRQHHTTIREAVDAIGRQTVPLYQSKPLYALYLDQSDMVTGSTYTWPLGVDDLVDVAIITNRVTDPTVVLHRDIDFRIDATAGTITFFADPFGNELFPQTTTFSGGAVSDAEIMVWLHDAQFDTDFLFSHLGYVIDLELDTSQAYKDAVNAVMAALVAGTSQATLETILSLIYDIPIVQGSQETVEAVETRGDTLLVVTDQDVYKYASTATAAVSAGDTVVAGQQLVDGFEIHNFRDGTIPAGLTDITLEEGMLAPGIGRLTFDNAEYTVTVTGANNRVSWPLGGSASDVEAFWDEVHARRVTYGSSLYELMAAAEGGSLLAVPTKVNPMQFLVENVLRNNALLVIVDQNAIGPNALTDAAATTLLRKILPPHCAVITELQ